MAQTDIQPEINTDQTEQKYHDLLERLIKVDSTTGREAEVGHVLVDFIKANFDCDTVELQPVEANRCNVIMSRGDGGSLHLTTHIDTVPVSASFGISQKIIKGTGACDAKGQVVTQLWALERAIAAGLENYCCFFVVGEEIDSVGAIAAMAHHLTGGEAVLNGEPTNGRFVRMSFGVVEMEVTAEGTKSHSSLAPLDSAIHKLIDALGPVLELEADDLLVNVGLIEGGTAPNVSADRAAARLCIRSALPTERIEAAVQSAVAGAVARVGEPASAVTASLITAADPVDFWVPPHEASPIDVTFGCDAGEYVGNYVRVLMYGPGDIADAHSVGEKVALADIRECARVISEMLLSSERDSEVRR